MRHIPLWFWTSHTWSFNSSGGGGDWEAASPFPVDVSEVTCRRVMDPRSAGWPPPAGKKTESVRERMYWIAGRTVKDESLLVIVVVGSICFCFDLPPFFFVLFLGFSFVYAATLINFAESRNCRKLTGRERYNYQQRYVIHYNSLQNRTRYFLRQTTCLPSYRVSPISNSPIMLTSKTSTRCSCTTTTTTFTITESYRLLHNILFCITSWWKGCQ